MKRECKLRKPIRVEVEDRSYCLTCPAYGILEKKESVQVLAWYRPPGYVPFASEPWPHTSKSPCCPECWAKIKENRK